ncbi:WG repeat-containing protein [Flavobacterium urocaniciphilum]|uniref:WG containing repeat-containing protein n=1 Tax=Flavobacterium urocaniciphilum TaxID=1299341 RepID=A0A1H9E7K3_9FLAO|nr:WG repeat-containing protein [Flavobacterium urocaniciphilum]SEQ21724.1 WG containing repeat-containing protein [Flavobacterium urocaniciphilum]
MKKIFFLPFIILITSISFSQTTNYPLIPYRDGKLWGFCDTLGKVVVKPYFDKVEDIKFDLFNHRKATFLLSKNNKRFVVDEKNQMLLPLNHSYDSIKLNKYDTEFIQVFKKGKMGFYSNLKEIIPCKYDLVETAGNNSFRVYVGLKCGLINSKNELIIPIQYDDVYASWKEIDEKNPKYVWLASNSTGEKKYYDTKIIQKPLDGDALPMLVMKEYDSSGEDFKNKNELLKLYDDVDYDANQNVVYVTKNNKLGVFDLKTEKILIEPKYDEISFLDTHKEKKVFKVLKEGKYGMLNENNEIVLPFEYDKIEKNGDLYLTLLFQNKKVGIKVFNTIYPTIAAKYLDVLDKESIQINNSWSFNIFLVKTINGIGYVGENGVEYFKN